MRRWLWGGTAVGLLFIWALVAAPQMRFQPAPEPPLGGSPADGSGAVSLDAIRSLAQGIPSIELLRIERVAGGLVEVDVKYVGEDAPADQQAWNRMAKDIANELTRSPANTQTVRVNLYQNETMRAQAVTTRSE